MSAALANFPRAVSHNLLHKSAFVSYTRYVAFTFGYFYAYCKVIYLQSYVESENAKKFEQLREIELSPHTLRGVQFHAPQVWDPEFTNTQSAFRDCYPDLYLHPNDEFVYQLSKGKQKLKHVKEELHAEAVEFLKEWKASESAP